MAIESPCHKSGDTMQIEVDTDVSLFVRDRATGRWVFNSKAMEALGLSPAELTQRGYPLDGEIGSPTTVPKDETLERPYPNIGR
jgi:hypothetical protein